MACPDAVDSGRAEQTYQQEACHQYDWHAHHMYPDIDRIAMVGAIEDELLFQIQRHVDRDERTVGKIGGWVLGGNARGVAD